MVPEGLEPIMAGKHGGRSRKPRAHICNHKHKADRAYGKGHETLNCRSPVPVTLPPVLQALGSAKAAILQPQTAAVSRNHHEVSDPVS